MKTKIINAVKSNDYNKVKELLEKEADVNAKDERDRTLLMIAVYNNNYEISKLLIENGADINEQDDMKNNLGWTALLEAIILGNGGKEHTEITDLLLKHGADPNIADRNGVTPLMHAKEKEYKEIETLLINAGAK